MLSIQVYYWICCEKFQVQCGHLKLGSSSVRCMALCRQVIAHWSPLCLVDLTAGQQSSGKENTVFYHQVFSNDQNYKIITAGDWHFTLKNITGRSLPWLMNSSGCLVTNELPIFWELTPSSFPCSRWKAPALCMPGKNHTGCVLMSRSSSPMSHGGCSSDPDPEEPTEEQSPRAPSPSEDKLSRLWNRWKKSG